MRIKERIKTCHISDICLIFNIIKDLKKDRFDEYFLLLIMKAYDLNDFKFVSEKGNFWLKNKNIVSKNENEVLFKILLANLRTKNQEENIIIFNTKKINYSFLFKNKILNAFSFTFIELEMYENSLIILEQIKNESNEYLENYIDCLSRNGQIEEALKMALEYKPKNDKGKIWKEMNIANMYLINNDIENLKKQTDIALNTFAKFRVSKDEILHSVYYYYLGKFREKLKEIESAKKMYKACINFPTELLIELKYKKKAETKLIELEVSL